jgi:hypothetical protein
VELWRNIEGQKNKYGMKKALLLPAIMLMMKAAEEEKTNLSQKKTNEILILFN